MGRSEDRIPSGPALCIGYRVSFPEVKRTGCALITHPYLATRLRTATAAPTLPVCVFCGMGNTALFTFLYNYTASLFTCYHCYRM